jgi:hypothetical protein
MDLEVDCRKLQISVRITGNPYAIRTSYVLNTSLKIYSYIDLLDIKASRI